MRRYLIKNDGITMKVFSILWSRSTRPGFWKNHPKNVKRITSEIWSSFLELQLAAALVVELSNQQFCCRVFFCQVREMFVRGLHACF